MIITADEDIKLVDLLLKAFPQSNRTRLKKAVRLGCVSFNGALAKHPELILQKGQSIVFKKYQAREDYKEKAPFKVLYEDEDIIVVFKPAGVLSSGRTTEKIRSMFGMVNSHIMQKTRQRQRAYTIHRLDREVCGLIMFAKNEETKLFLQDNWKDVGKRYYAVVEGCPEKDSGVINSFLKENSRQVVYSLKEEEPGAKWAVTHYKVLDYNKEEDRALLNVELATGRKNQIRVHLSDLGCPIVGDRKYGADPTQKISIHLMSYYLSFPHPKDGQIEVVETPLLKSFWA